MKPLLFFLTSLLFWTACSPDPTGDSVESNSPSVEPSADLSTAVAPLQKGPLFTAVEATAVVDVPPQFRANVHAPCAAYVATCSVLLGESVRKGQVLATLEHPDILIKQAALLEAHAEWEFALATYNRNLPLAESKAISDRDFQEIRRNYSRAQAVYQAANQEVKWLGLDPSFILDNGIQRTIELRAPISGSVVEANINLGKFVGPDASLFKIVGRDHSHMELSVFAAYLNRVEVGDSISAMTETGEVFAGEVFLIANAVDAADNRFHVHGHFLDEGHAPAPGTFLSATLFSRLDSVWTLPEEALWREDDSWWALMAQGVDGSGQTSGKDADGNGDASAEGAGAGVSADAGVHSGHDRDFVPVQVVRGPSGGGRVAIRNGEDFKGALFAVENVYYLRHASRSEEEPEGHAH